MILPLAQDEQIVLELRRHWFIFFLETIFLIIFVCLPFMILIFLDSNILPETYSNLIPWFKFATAAWFLFTWVTFFVLWTNFYLDVWIITNRRIIDVEQYALFNREVSEFRIDKIQDSTVNVHGFIPTMLGYGDILIETASEQKNCRIKDAPNPEQVKNLISHLQAELPASHV